MSIPTKQVVVRQRFENPGSADEVSECCRKRGGEYSDKDETVPEIDVLHKKVVVDQQVPTKQKQQCR